MPKLKTQAARDSLLRRVRKQRLKYIAILPSLITLLNGVCGFASMVFASKGAYALAGKMLILAMIADMLDGRVARMSKSTSSFGGQLDSLCDMISFGAAPALLMLMIFGTEIETYVEPSMAFSGFINRFVWLAAATYLSCAAIRLARFNVENEEDESAHMSFVGLPTPAAAGVVASLVIFDAEVLNDLVENGPKFFAIFDNIVIYAMPFILMGVGVLMVSRIRYPHIVNQYLKGKKPLAHFIRLLAVGLIVWIIPQTALVLIFCGFAVSGVAKWIFLKLKKTPPLDTQEENAELDNDDKGQVTIVSHTHNHQL